MNTRVQEIKNVMDNTIVTTMLTPSEEPIQPKVSTEKKADTSKKAEKVNDYQLIKDGTVIIYSAGNQKMRIDRIAANLKATQLEGKKFKKLRKDSFESNKEEFGIYKAVLDEYFKMLWPAGIKKTTKLDKQLVEVLYCLSANDKQIERIKTSNIHEFIARGISKNNDPLNEEGRALRREHLETLNEIDNNKKLSTSAKEEKKKAEVFAYKKELDGGNYYLLPKDAQIGFETFRTRFEKHIGGILLSIDMIEEYKEKEKREGISRKWRPLKKQADSVGLKEETFISFYKKGDLQGVKNAIAKKKEKI